MGQHYRGSQVNRRSVDKVHPLLSKHRLQYCKPETLETG